MASGSQDVDPDSCLQLAQQLREARAAKRWLRRQRKLSKAAATVCEDKDDSKGQTNPARGTGMVDVATVEAITPRRAMPPFEKASSGDTPEEGKRQREVAQGSRVDAGGGTHERILAATSPLELTHISVSLGAENQAASAADASGQLKVTQCVLVLTPGKKLPFILVWSRRLEMHARSLTRIHLRALWSGVGKEVKIDSMEMQSSCSDFLRTLSKQCCMLASAGSSQPHPTCAPLRAPLMCRSLLTLPTMTSVRPTRSLD